MSRTRTRFARPRRPHRPGGEGVFSAGHIVNRVAQAKADDQQKYIKALEIKIKSKALEIKTSTDIADAMTLCR